MKIIRRLFSVNTLILLAAATLVPPGVQHTREIFYGMEKLIAHKGIVEKKHMSHVSIESRNNFTHKDEQVLVPVFNFKIKDDPSFYRASRYPEALDNLVQPGDTITFYTKALTSHNGSMVTTGRGRGWNTNSPNEVFHIVSDKYASPIMDYNEHIEELKATVWLWPLGSILFLGWYFYRRSNAKSALVQEKATFF